MLGYAGEHLLRIPDGGISGKSFACWDFSVMLGAIGGIRLIIDERWGEGGEEGGWVGKRL